MPLKRSVKNSEYLQNEGHCKTKPCSRPCLARVPVPAIKENEVLIKIHTTAICGTDHHIYNWDAWAQKNVPTPLIIGHEFMGHIDKVGRRLRATKWAIA